MADSDRQRLLAKALALPHASASDFFKRSPPDDADPALLRRINDTALRTKLVEVGLAVGLQSPKGPQRIASIVRIYPAFDAPARSAAPSNGAPPGAKKSAATVTPDTRRLPAVEDIEALVARIRAVESELERDLAARAGERIDQLKTALGTLDGDELDAAYRELGEALEAKRALRSHIRFEAFERVENDRDFAPRAYLRFLRR